MQVQNSTPVSWILDHLNLIGWPSVCYVVFKIARFLNKIQQRAEAVENNVNAVTVNHIPHLQESLHSIDDTLKRQEIRWEAWLTAQAAQKHKED
jgi:hypothetical protein